MVPSKETVSEKVRIAKKQLYTARLPVMVAAISFMQRE
jgi:hypothetical protein